MKHLSTAVAALFLLATPSALFAQETGTGTDTGKGGVSIGDTGTGSTNGTGGDVTGSTSRGDQNCTKVGPGATFESMNGKCRDEINIWIQKQNAQDIPYEGDVTVGTELPGSVTFVEVPAYRDYGYARINGRNVLIDRETHRVVYVD